MKKYAKYSKNLCKMYIIKAIVECLSDDEKEIIEGMRSLEAEQVKRVQTYFKGFLAAKKQEKN